MQDAVDLFEKYLAQEVKNELQAFFAYACSKTNIKESLSRLRHSDGALITSTKEAPELLNKEFQNVLTKGSESVILRAQYQLEGDELRQYDITGTVSDV